MNIFKKSIRRHPHLCFIQNAFEPTRPPSTALLRPPPSHIRQLLEAYAK